MHYQIRRHIDCQIYPPAKAICAGVGVLFQVRDIVILV